MPPVEIKTSPYPVPLLYRFIYDRLRVLCDANLCISPAVARKRLARTIFGLDYDHIMFLFQELKAYGFIEKVGVTSIQLVDVKWDEEK